MKKLKIVYISSIAAPHQIKLCYALQRYLDIEFWFYDEIGGRADWWNIERGDKCKIINKVFFKYRTKYVALGLLDNLRAYKPDLIILGGLPIPSNMLAYSWAKKNNIKTAIVSEKIHNEGKEVSLIEWQYWKFIFYFYRNVDLFITTSDQAKQQITENFFFFKNVKTCWYAADLEKYLNHKLRKLDRNDEVRILFANTLKERYNPLLAIDIVEDLVTKYPNVKLMMNSSGHLRSKCEKIIAEKKIYSNIEFIDNINSWNDLHTVYENCHLYILTASFSVGAHSLQESMASGLGIVISDNIEGPGQLIKNNYNGYICKLNKEDFVSAIITYIENGVNINQYGKINKQLIKPYTTENTAKKFSKIIIDAFFVTT